jgi:Glyoxalase-like domain
MAKPGASRKARGEVADMASVIKSVSFDAADALALARFWAAVSGSDVDEDWTTDRAFVEAAGWGGPNIWFSGVPEPKAAKNRMHFDLRAPGAVAAGVSRLKRLGAAVMRSYPGHAVMQDREGNEFCVEPGPA